MSTTIDTQKSLRDAAGYGRIDDVRKYLNDDTVNVNGKKDGDGFTGALHWACSYGHDDDGKNPLDIAKEKKHQSIIASPRHAGT